MFFVAHVPAKRGGFVVEIADAGSVNGTFVNGRRLAPHPAKRVGTPGSLRLLTPKGNKAKRISALRQEQQHRIRLREGSILTFGKANLQMVGTDGRRTPGKGQSELIYKLHFPKWIDRPNSLTTTRFNLALPRDDLTSEGGVPVAGENRGEIRHELEEEILSLRKNADNASLRQYIR